MRSVRGSVLLASALVVVLIYATMTLSVANTRRTLAVTKHARARVQADYLARAGLAWGEDQLRSDPDWAAAHTGNPARFTVDPAAPEVEVWLEPTAEPEFFELRARTSVAGQQRSATALFHRSSKIEGRLYAITQEFEDPHVFHEYSSSWGTLPTPLGMYWSAPGTPALSSTGFAADFHQLRGDSRGNLFMLARPGDIETLQPMAYDRAQTRWKLLPQVPTTLYNAAGQLVAAPGREVTALAGNDEVLYAVANLMETGPLIPSPGEGAPAIAQVVYTATVFRLDDPLGAGFSWSPSAGWQAGSGSWVTVGRVPAPFSRGWRGCVDHRGRLFVADDVASSGGSQVRCYNPADGSWTSYPTPPSTVYARGAQGKLSIQDLTEAATPQGLPEDSVVSSSSTRNYYGVTEVDPEGNLYWYLDPTELSGTVQMLPTLYKFEPARTPPEGAWKLVALPLDQAYDLSGQLTAGHRLTLWDMSARPDGKIMLGFGTSEFLANPPTFYEYGGGSGYERPGSPRVPPIPGRQVSYDASVPGLCRWTSMPALPTNLRGMASGGVIVPGEWSWRPTAEVGR